MTLRSLILLAIILVAAAGAGSIPARAQQQQDLRDLIDRVDRIERDLNIMQSQFYRSQSGGGSGAASGTTVINSPAASLSGDAYSQLDQRISALEDEVRSLTGEIEEASHAAQEVNSRLDRMQADNEVRFKELEQKVGIGATTAAAPQASDQSAAAGGSPQAASGQGQANKEDWNPTQGSAPHPLGQMSESDLKRLEPKNTDGAQTASAGTAPPAPAFVPKTPQEQYDAAFTMLRNNDNDGAAKAFQAFLAQHPKDPLAGNATFWLGQIAFAQGKYEQAAPIFFDAYSKYPRSAKAGESLLKVGLSMSKLNKKKEACAAVVRFLSEFPDASESLKRQAQAEKQKLVCGG